MNDLMALDDAQLAQRVAKQDRRAAAALVTRYQASLRTFLGKLTGKPDIADDIAQETFVRMLRYADRYDPQYPMKTWLYTIARRLLINRMRDQSRIADTDQFDHQPSSNPSPAERVSRDDHAQWTQGLLHEALQELSDPQREVILLFYHQDQSVEQIADLMDMPQGTVKSHLHRARTNLRKRLTPQWEALKP